MGNTLFFLFLYKPKYSGYRRGGSYKRPPSMFGQKIGKMSQRTKASKGQFYPISLRDHFDRSSVWFDFAKSFLENGNVVLMVSFQPKPQNIWWWWGGMAGAGERKTSRFCFRLMCKDKVEQYLTYFINIIVFDVNNF